MDYCIDPNVFNLIINLLLEYKDFETSLMMFELIFDSKLTKIDLSHVDVSKQSLKVLLMIQTKKLKDGSQFQFEDFDKSEIMSVLSQNSPSQKSKLKEINEKWFPELNNPSNLLAPLEEDSLVEISNTSKSFELI